MPADIARALAFVRERITPSEAARLAYLIGQPQSSDALAALFADQRPDGGFAPFWAADYSSLDATCFRLARAEQCGLAPGRPEASALDRALRFLQGRQRIDGAWEEDAAVADIAPPWAAPGDLAARLYLTANCAFWLARWAISAAPAGAARRGGRLLAGHLGADGALPSFRQATWLAAGLWLRLGEDEPARGALAALDRLLDEPSSTEALTWLLATLLSAGLSAAHPLIARGATLLDASQRADGAWPSEDGPAREVHTTLEALYVLRLLHRW